tara:strand:+ start:4608 stop:4865 length:258 start_codon:yes stop_codon:yes gene_type:complete
MKAFAIFFLFIGIILVIQAYYKNLSACPKPKTIIKYVPRSIYEDQLSDKQKLTEFYKIMFDGSNKSDTIINTENNEEEEEEEELI